MDELRVLIVDDEEDLVNALVERLELRGVNVEGVHSGTEALEAIWTKPFDVVLLDVRMPGLSGRELIERIYDHQPDVKIVLLTGHGAKENLDLGERYAATDCLLKPVNIDVLLETLQRATGRL